MKESSLHKVGLAIHHSKGLACSVWHMNRDGRNNSHQSHIEYHSSQASSLHGQTSMLCGKFIVTSQRCQFASRKVGVAKLVCILCLTNQNLLPPPLYNEAAGKGPAVT